MAEYHTRLPSIARRTLEQHAQIDCKGIDGFIRIAITDPTPNRAAAMANAYVEAFRTLLHHLETNKAHERRLLFEGQLKDARKHLSQSEKSLALAEQKTGLITMNDQTRALIDADAALRSRIVTEEVRVRSLKSYTTTESPEILQAQMRLRALRAELVELNNDTRARNTSMLLSEKRLPKARYEYNRDLRKVEYYQSLVNVLAKQAELARVDEARHAAVLVVDSATSPEKPSSPRPASMIAGAFIAGILAGMFWAIATYGFDRLKAKPSENAKLLYLRHVLGITRIWRSQAKA